MHHRLRTELARAALLVAAAGVVVIPQTAISAAPKKGSSCAHPWTVEFSEKTDFFNSGNTDVIKLRLKSDSFSDPDWNLLRVTWDPKGSGRRICVSTGKLTAGNQIDGCSKSATFNDRGWRISGPGGGWCDLKLLRGDGNSIVSFKVTAARSRAR